MFYECSAKKSRSLLLFTVRTTMKDMGCVTVFCSKVVSIYVRLRKPLHIPQEVPCVHNLLVLIQALNDEFDPER